MEILSSHDKCLHGKNIPCNPLPYLTSLPIQEKNSPENVNTLPNNHYYM